jgi:hypothetical protein
MEDEGWRMRDCGRQQSDEKKRVACGTHVQKACFLPSCFGIADATHAECKNIDKAIVCARLLDDRCNGLAVRTFNRCIRTAKQVRITLS